jgi:GNAT superfamily N-acetyltransferase
MQSNLRIERAKPQDAAYLSDLALKSKGYWGYGQEFLEKCRAELTYTPQQLASTDYFFANAIHIPTNRIVGFYVLFFTQKNTVELEALFVDPTIIGQGVGRTLFSSAAEKARQRNCVTMVIQADPYAETFYLKHGAKWVTNMASKSIVGRQLPILHLQLD